MDFLNVFDDFFKCMFSPLKRYKIQHQEFKFGVFRSISGHL